jgi:hypothetical protein
LQFFNPLALTMNRKKMSMLYIREKLPEPFGIAGDRPFWTIEQIEKYKAEVKD